MDYHETFQPYTKKTPAWRSGFFPKIGAGNEIRTRDPNLGKVVLYQLSYSRIIGTPAIVMFLLVLSRKKFVLSLLLIYSIIHFLVGSWIVHTGPSGLYIYIHRPYS